MWKTPVGAFLALSVSAFMVMGSQVQAGTNLLTNPGFESSGGSYDGWTTFGAGPNLSLPAGDNIIHTGAAASKIFGEFNNCPDFPSFDVGGYFQAFTPIVGNEYTFSGFYYASSADPILGTFGVCDSNRVLAQIAFFDAAVDGSLMATNEALVGSMYTPLDEWLEFNITTVAPVGAMRVEALILFLQPECGTGSAFLDDLSLCTDPPEAKSNLLTNPSFATSLSGWNLFGNVFSEFQVFGIRTPLGSAKMFSTFTPDSPSGLFQSFDAVEGTSFELSGHATSSCASFDAVADTNSNYVVARLVFNDATGTEISAEEVRLYDNTFSVGEWKKSSVVATAPAGTDSVHAFILFISPFEGGGSIFVDDICLQEVNLVGVSAAAAPGNLKLLQNVPNPFTRTTRIDFVLSQPEQVNITVYDIAGRQVVTLQNGTVSSGRHSVIWDGRTSGGARVAPGVYHYVIKTPSGRVSRSMAILQ